MVVAGGAVVLLVAAPVYGVPAVDDVLGAAAGWAVGCIAVLAIGLTLGVLSPNVRVASSLGLLALFPVVGARRRRTAARGHARRPWRRCRPAPVGPCVVRGAQQLARHRSGWRPHRGADGLGGGRRRACPVVDPASGAPSVIGSRQAPRGLLEPSARLRTMASTTLPVTLDDVLAARELLRGRRPADPAGVQPGAVRAGRRPGLPQVREPAARRVVQDPRRLHADRPAVATRRRRAASSRPAPATTPRASRSRRSCSASRSTVFMPRARRSPRSMATRAYGAEVRAARPHGRRVRWCAAREFADRDRRGADPPVRPPRHRRRAGHGRAGDPRAVPDVATVLVVHRRRRAARRHRHRGQGACARTCGSSASRPSRRRPTRRRWRPGARCRSTRMATMADGIAVGCPGEVPFAIVQRARRRHRRRCREESLSRALLLCWSGPSWSSSRPARPGWRRCSTTRRAFEPPVVAVLSGGNIDPLLLLRVLRHGLAAAGRYLPFRVRVPDRPGRAGRAARRCGRRPTPTCSRSSTCAPTPQLRVDEVEVGAPAGDQGRASTASRCSPRCARRATRSSSTEHPSAGPLERPGRAGENAMSSARTVGLLVDGRTDATRSVPCPVSCRWHVQGWSHD